MYLENDHVPECYKNFGDLKIKIKNNTNITSKESVLSSPVSLTIFGWP